VPPGRAGTRAPGGILAAILVVLAIALWLGSTAAAQPSPLTREAIEELVRDYLLNHPEVIVESLQRAQQRQRVARQEQARAAVRAHQQELVSDPGSPVGGNPAGDVTVVEFFDYRCPHCRRMVPVIKALLAEDRGVRLVYKEMPILGDESLVAARAALAAVGQGKYVEAHDQLMAEAGSLTRAAVLATLAGIGLDRDRLSADMESPEVSTRIARGLALAQALGIDGTPAFVVGGELVVGSVDLETLRELVTRARRAP
jgi:protein-disulfide isomerase